MPTNQINYDLSNYLAKNNELAPLPRQEIKPKSILKLFLETVFTLSLVSLLVILILMCFTQEPPVARLSSGISKTK